MRFLYFIVFNFVIYIVGHGQPSLIKSYEYWYNGNYGSRVINQVSPSESLEMDFLFETHGLPLGLNTYQIRFQDEAGRYSSIVSTSFIKLNAIANIGSDHLLSCEYWFNDNYASRTIIPIAGANDYVLLEDIQTTGLKLGVNTFNFRVKNLHGTWSSTYSQMFIKVRENPINDALSICEYWYNGNFAARTSIEISNQGMFNLLEILNAANLPAGLNTFSCRFKNTNDLWSSILTQSFIRTEDAGLGPQLTAYEYWYNHDFNNRTAGVINNMESFQFLESLDAGNLPVGLNTFSIRFKNNNKAKWSSALTHLFIKNDSNEAGDSLTAFEYWFNNGYSQRVYVELTPQANLNFLQAFDVSTLPEGINAFTIRFKNRVGLWSSGLTALMVKKPTALPSLDSLIYGYRYWYDDEFTEASFVTLDPPINAFILSSSMDMTRIWKGSHTIHFQFMDARETWSGILSAEVVKTPYPIADFTIVNNYNCPGASVTFINNSMDADTFLWSFGDGQFSNEEDPLPHVYNSSGSYAVGLTVTDLNTGFDSTLVLPGAVLAEGLEVYSKSDSMPGSLRNVIYCAMPGSYISFNVDLDSTLLEAPLLIEKSMDIQNGNPNKVQVLGNFSLPGFNGKDYLLKNAQGNSLLLSGLELTIKNNLPDKKVVVNNGLLTIENLVLRSNVGIKLLNEKIAPSDDVQVTVNGNVSLKSN